MDWNFIAEIGREINIGQLIAIGLMFWFFYSRLNGKIEKVENRIEKLEDRILSMEHDMIEIKTILRMKECCMIKDERKLPKVE